MALLPDNFDEAVADFLQTGLCVAAGTAEGLANLVAGLVPGFGNQTVANINRAIRLRACGDDGPSPLAPVVSGGQCPGISYQCQAIGTNTGNGNPFNVNVGNFTGPIRAQSVDPSLLPPSCPAPNFLSNIEFRDGNDSLVIRQSGCAPFPQDIRIVATPLSAEPGGGCGDGDIIPPGFEPSTGPVTYEGDTVINIDESTNITIPTTVIFAPIYADIDGSLNVPFDIDIGEIAFKGTLELFPDFTVELFPNGINPGGGQLDNPDELEEPSPAPAPTPPDDPNDRRAIIGVYVTSQIPPGAIQTAIAFTDGPEIYAPRLGSVRFLVLVEGFSGWTNDIDIKTTEAYIHCPVPQGAIAVRCSPAPGVTLQFSPVRGRVLR